MKKVAVLIVTYNRKEYLKKLIDGLFNQTYKISSILIFDNNSNDGTENMLLKEGFIDNVIVDTMVTKEISNITMNYYKNSENTGGSGGFNKGLDLISKFECDYIWAMDDDVLPENNCLERLIEELKNKRVCIPNRSDENYIDYGITKVDMSNPLKYNISKRKKKIYPQEMKTNVINVVDMPFEGPIFEKSIINEVGLPNKDLFIIFDDSEYAYRICKITSIGFVKNAILHKQIIPSKSNNEMGWKEYYGYRNQYWFDRKYGKNIFVKYLRPFLNHCDLMLKSFIKNRPQNRKVLRASYYDGTRGILGKKVNPGKDFEWRKN